MKYSIVPPECNVQYPASRADAAKMGDAVESQGCSRRCRRTAAGSSLSRRSVTGGPACALAPPHTRASAMLSLGPAQHRAIAEFLSQFEVPPPQAAARARQSRRHRAVDPCAILPASKLRRAPEARGLAPWIVVRPPVRLVHW